MLQKYEIAVNSNINRLTIKEFAVLETKSRKLIDYIPVNEDYSLLLEISYELDSIRETITKGQKALIAELRSPNFFPIYPYIEIIANKIKDVINGDDLSTTEIFLDDRTLLSTHNEEN